ncbi:MAG TPA: class I SAM-dependent rRNA methyltransferase [Vicinamibacterales bacterium]|nr:class I SAM-dependent rRNA methyltransferase [Vicinamibacterales bacterium]
MTPVAVIGPRGEERLRRGHLWVYRSDIVEVRAAGGDVVRVLNTRGRPLVHALYSDRSEIALRAVSRGDEPPDEAFWRERLERAIAYRAALDIDATAYRVVHGEGDLLPSLVVDRYGDYLVLQALSQGMERLTPLVVATLVERLRPAGILARNDPKVRRLEGLEQKVELLHGDVPDRVEVREGGVRVEADLWRGQKTGLFLDQRENRAAAARYAHGRLLDAFCYQGGFALALAARCAQVIALDISDQAIAAVRANAERNGLALETRVANAFDALRDFERGGERFDTIVLDPPAFAKSRAAVAKAAAGYKEINLRAMKLLAPGGVLVTCSCSYHVSEPMFAAIVQEAAGDARAAMVVVERRTQARDHPVLVGVPETAYLKCLILRRLA